MTLTTKQGIILPLSPEIAACILALVEHQDSIADAPAGEINLVYNKQHVAVYHRRRLGGRKISTLSDESVLTLSA